MKQTDKELYVSLLKEGEEFAAFATLVEEKTGELKDRNIIVDLSREKDLQPAQFLGIVNVSDTHRQGNKSFVVITDAVGVDDVPEELILVPTLREAEDLIQMEEIERDLGF